MIPDVSHVKIQPPNASLVILLRKDNYLDKVAHVYMDMCRWVLFAKFAIIAVKLVHQILMIPVLTAILQSGILILENVNAEQELMIMELRKIVSPAIKNVFNVSMQMQLGVWSVIQHCRGLTQLPFLMLVLAKTNILTLLGIHYAINVMIFVVLAKIVQIFVFHAILLCFENLNLFFINVCVRVDILMMAVLFACNVLMNVLTVIIGLIIALNVII